jgi:hypothetical protein
MSNREYGDEYDDEENLPRAMCPECDINKHTACVGAAWDHITDGPAICSCWAAGHHVSH